MVPPMDFNVCEYHLQAPKEFLQQGRIASLPHNVYANMPLGAEMLSLLGMVLAGDWWAGGLVAEGITAAFTRCSPGAFRRPPTIVDPCGRGRRIGLHLHPVDHRRFDERIDRQRDGVLPFLALYALLLSFHWGDSISTATPAIGSTATPTLTMPADNLAMILL